ncbi:MAG: hypothetical protein HDT26_00520 [Subdoligranulum sp.]|nr:hypothetical protein [Subdoligranulum sp.]
MAETVNLTAKFAPYTDEIFKAESKRSLLTNTDFDWSGAHSVLIWKIASVPLNDYQRHFNRITGEETENISDASISRYGKIQDVTGQTEEMLLKKDRSFIFNLDKLDTDETEEQVAAASALARELREVVIPEVDAYTYDVMIRNAGLVADAVELTKNNIYDLILAGSEAMDDEEVPETERVLVVTPGVYTLLKKSTAFDNTDVGADLKLKGVVGILDGMAVVKVPASRLPEDFGFSIVHPSATVAPVKLEDYGVHPNTVLSSGTIVTGRICYDAFVLENKKNGIYYQPLAKKTK